MKHITIAAITLAAAVVAAPAFAAFEPQQSPQLVRAKDYIADEQWDRAIEQLTAAVADTKGRSRDEALFWLAHSQHQVRDYEGSLKSIRVIETNYPKSPWVKPAQSLRIEIAQKMEAREVLWYTVRPDGAVTVSGTQAAAASGRQGVRGSAGASSPGPATSPRTMVRSGNTVAAAPGSTFWFSETWSPDAQQRLLALGSLMQTDAPKVIPILKNIALESPDPGEASRAIFVLAQSGKPEAHNTVLEVARQGSELVQIAAVRELGRFGGPKVAEELLEVYSASAPRVKNQVVAALGDRRATTALMEIVRKESDRQLRERAILRVGQAGGRRQLHEFYDKAAPGLKTTVIIGLFNAGAEQELRSIAERERDENLRREALTRVSLLSSAKLRADIEKRQQNR